MVAGLKSTHVKVSKYTNKVCNLFFRNKLATSYECSRVHIPIFYCLFKFLLVLIKRKFFPKSVELAGLWKWRPVECRNGRSILLIYICFFGPNATSIYMYLQLCCFVSWQFSSLCKDEACIKCVN